MKKDIVCTRCGETDSGKFLMSKLKKSDYRCRVCINKMQREYYRDNPEKQAECNKRWREKHPEKAKELSRLGMFRWASKNRINYNQRAKKWRDSHPQEWREIVMRYRHNNTKAYNCQAMAQRHFPARQVCEIETCESFGERHHDDYDKPLKIRWLCKKHHRQYHRNLTSS